MPGGATVRLFRECPNLYGDLSPAAGSGYHAIHRSRGAYEKICCRNAEMLLGVTLVA